MESWENEPCPAKPGSCFFLSSQIWLLEGAELPQQCLDADKEFDLIPGGFC